MTKWLDKKQVIMVRSSLQGNVKCYSDGFFFILVSLEDDVMRTTGIELPDKKDISYNIIVIIKLYLIDYFQALFRI